MKKTLLIVTLALLLLLSLSAAALAGPLDNLQTPAEQSNWTRTTSSQEVIDFCKTVAANSDGRIILDYTFTTDMGSSIPYLIIGKPAPTSPEQVGEDKAVAYINCNIHSGEIEGKEAMLIFAREVAQGKHDDLLKDLVIIVCPNSSPDGNDNLGKNRITTQFTPQLVGTRPDGQGLNVNRDMTKLESVCGRSIVELMTLWDPELFVDAHATDGSYMRHAITYNWGLNAGTYYELLEYNRDVFCEKALRSGSYLEQQGKIAVPYGNWGFYYSDIVAEGWRTFEDYARYTTNYAGLRNRLTVLLEVYSYDDFHTRMETSYACILGCLQTLAADKEEIKAQIAKADARSIGRAKSGLDEKHDFVALNSEMTILKLAGQDKLTVLSYATNDEGMVIGERIYNEAGDPIGIEYGEPTDYETDYWGAFVPTKSEALGAYYLIDGDCTEFIETLLFHGVQVTKLDKDVKLGGAAYQWFNIETLSAGNSTVDGRVRRQYEGHYQYLLTGAWQQGDKAITIPAGTYVVSTAQQLGSLVGVMCEPGCVDGGVAWNFFDDHFDAKDGSFRMNYASTVDGVDYSTPILKLASFSAIKPGKDYLARMDFKDVTVTKYYFDSVYYVFENKLMGGTGDGLFQPNATMSREQLVTVLYRQAGSPAVTEKSGFSDMVAGAYYEDAVAWAKANNIVNGYADGSFGVGAPVTREQFVSFLYRFAQFQKADVSVGEDVNILSYTDSAQVSEYAIPAMQWACGAGVVKGENGALNPLVNNSRANAAVMLARFCQL